MDTPFETEHGRIMRAIAAFDYAAGILSRVLEDHKYADVAASGYPFKDSFDEITVLIDDWTSSMETTLRDNFSHEEERGR